MRMKAVRFTSVKHEDGVAADFVLGAEGRRLLVLAALDLHEIDSARDSEQAILRFSARSNGSERAHLSLK